MTSCMSFQRSPSLSMPIVQNEPESCTLIWTSMPIWASCAWMTSAMVFHVVAFSVSMVSGSDGGPPAFFEELARLVQIALGRDQRLLAVADAGPARSGRWRACLAEIGGVHDLRHVDRLLDRLAQVDVLERRVVQVHADPDVVERRIFLDHRVLRRAVALYLRERATA